MRASIPAPAGPHWANYYRATPVARLPGVLDEIQARSLYLYDVLMLCLRGVWELELRGFMPPASLCAAVKSLLEMGLIERLEQP